MTENNCEVVRPRLSAYYDGELVEQQGAQVASHVQQCESCADELLAFRSIGAAFSQTRPSTVPPEVWGRIEDQLRSRHEPITLASRVGTLLRESPYRAGLVSLAASILLILGVSSWIASDHVPMQMASHGSGAMHSHDDDMSADHMAEFVGVIDDYLGALATDPEEAERMLLSKYQGERVDADRAVQLVGYRPIVSRGLPDGYSLASTSVLKMPCCTCVKAVCKRNDGSTLVLFEHDDEETAWFGNRPSSMAMCGDKDCCLVDLDSNIAATWKQGTRSVTAVGVRDQEEVKTLVKWLGAEAGSGGVGRKGA